MQKQNKECDYGEQGWLRLDITIYVKQTVEDVAMTTELLGSVLTCVDGYAILGTSDNGEYIPYLRIVLSSPPEYAIKRDSINEGR